MSHFDFWNSGRRILQATVVACLLAAASTGSAQAANYVGWAYELYPTSTGCNSPPWLENYNSAGGTIVLCRISTGYYEVEFGSLYGGQPDNVQVTSANYTNEDYCQSAGWVHSGTTVVAYVECFAANGTPDDNVFMLQYQARTSGFGNSRKGIAYLYANNPSAASYTPTTSYQFNSTGGTNTIVRNGTGNYTVNVPGLVATNSDVQVTAYNRDDFAVRCSVVSWYGSSGSTSINVQCYNSSGQAADEFFTLAYAVNEPFGLTTTESHSEGAWAWANNDTDTSVYTPNTNYQYNDFGTGNLTAQKLSTGAYEIVVPGGPNFTWNTVLITAYGNNGNYCGLDGYQGSGDPNGYTEVLCFSQGGYPADTQFDVAIQTAE